MDQDERMRDSIGQPRSIVGKTEHLLPVLRHRSFIGEGMVRKGIVFREHTAETIVLYACDLPKGYFLITTSMLEEAGLEPERLHELSMNNLKRLDVPVRTQQLGENRIHFISPSDGYAASRVLLTELICEYDQNRQGYQLGVAIPHHDVLIIADIGDERGAQLLARVTYDFAQKGDVPVCPIPFLFEDGELVPYLSISK